MGGVSSMSAMRDAGGLTELPLVDADVPAELTDVHSVRARSAQDLDRMARFQEAQARREVVLQTQTQSQSPAREPSPGEG